MADVEDESYWCEQVFQEFEFSVVRLHSAAGQFCGNGSVVHGGSGAECLILTCQHVLGEAGVPVGGTMAAHFSNSHDHYNATVLYVDEGRDLALLRAPQVLERVTPLRFFDEPIVSGWTVVALSFINMGANVILEPGTFSGEIINGPDDAYLNCSCTSKPGASGSPIILAGVNEVVAVVAGASLASVYSIPVRTIEQFLRGWLGAGDDLNIAINGLVTLAAAKR